MAAPRSRSRAAAAPQATPDAANLGPRIRAVRRKKGLTLDEVARAAGLHKAHLSRLERGERSASIATVMKLTDALGLSVGALFGEKTDHSEVKIIRNIAGRPRNGRKSDQFVGMGAAGNPHALGVFMLHPGHEFSKEGPSSHPGSEFFFVVKGSVEVRFADRLIKLAQGDCLLFPGSLPHNVRSLVRSSAVLILINQE